MQFFVEISGELSKVQVARTPKDINQLALFKRTNGSTFTGAPSLFNGLRSGGKKGLYTAISVKLQEVTVEMAPEPIQETIVIVPPVVVKKEEPVPEPYPCSVCNEIDFRKYSFVFDYEQVSPSKNQNEAWLEYVNEKSVWIRRFGSENLKLAQEMNCKCDNRYIVERANKEFPMFEIHEEYPMKEVDTPDVAILRFLKLNAFDDFQRNTIRKYRSRIVVAFPYDDEEQVPGTEVLVIRGFLGMCDLVCSLAGYIYHVEQFNDSRMPHVSYSVSD